MSASKKPWEIGRFEAAGGETRIGRRTVSDIADLYGTPLYIYDTAIITEKLATLHAARPPCRGRADAEAPERRPHRGLQRRGPWVFDEHAPFSEPPAPRRGSRHRQRAGPSQKAGNLRRLVFEPARCSGIPKAQDFWGLRLLVPMASEA